MTQAETVARADVTDLLVAQHSQIRDLFAEVMTAGSENRAEPFRRLVRLLAVHETAEEEIVHPLARRLPGGSGIIGDRLREEREAKKLLASLERTGPAAPDFLARLDRLRLAVLTHARAEERYEFSRLRGQFTGPQRRAMAAVVRAAEAIAPTHPHPGVETAAANLLVGPMAAVVDRTRDLIRAGGG